MIPKTDSKSAAAIINKNRGEKMPRKLILGIAFVLSLIAIHRAEAKEGFYLGGELLYNNIDGDFDGTKGPDADAGGGIGLILGYGFTPGLSLEIDWNATVHTATVPGGGTPSDAGLGAFILALKYNFLSDQPLQPFLRAGVGGYAFTLKDPRGDFKLTGSGLDVGLGADYYVSPHFSIGAGLSRRLIKYNKVEFLGPETNLRPKLKGDTTALEVTFVYHF